MNWIKGTGYIEIDNGVRIITHFDLCRYYQWFVKKEFWNTKKTQLPAHGAHVTVINPKLIDVNRIKDFARVNWYKNKKVEFKYSPEDIHWGRVNFWIPVECPIVAEIHNFLNIRNYKCEKGPHLTVCNMKFNNENSGKKNVV